MITPKKEYTEYKFEKNDNPRLSITITTDKDNRITDIRNPYRISHPFRLSFYLHKHILDKWKESNDLIERGRMTYSENLKGNELIKHLVKNPAYYYNNR